MELFDMLDGVTAPKSDSDFSDVVISNPSKDDESKPMDLFEILDAMTVHKYDLDFSDESISKPYSQFVINKFLSMCEILLPYVEEVCVMKLSDEMHYEYLCSVLPKRKFYYKFIKATKDVDAEDKRYIADYFEIGIKDVEGFIDIIDEDEVKNILSKYKYGKNQRIVV